MKGLISVTIFLIISFFILTLTRCSNDHLVMKVAFTSSGCFASEVSEIRVYEYKDSTTAILETKGEKSIQVRVSEGQLPALSLFLKEFNALKGDGCFSTTIDEYTVSTKEATIKKEDGCCSWNGFYKLKNVLFLEK